MMSNKNNQVKNSDDNRNYDDSNLNKYNQNILDALSKDYFKGTP
jgi:hypothetical protein